MSACRAIGAQSSDGPRDSMTGYADLLSLWTVSTIGYIVGGVGGKTAAVWSGAGSVGVAGWF